MSLFWARTQEGELRASSGLGVDAARRTTTTTMHKSSPSPTNMAEQLNFYRKFYASKFKRSRVAPPAEDGGSAGRTPQNGYEQQDCERDSPNLEDEPGQEQADDGQSEIRASGATNLEHFERGLSNLAHNSDRPEAAAADGEQTTEADRSADPAAELGAAPDAEGHIETLNFHPDTQSANTSEASETRRDRKESRLSRATRAILLFRRATTSLNNVSGSATPRRQNAGFSASRSLVSAFWRQNTAPDASGARSSRLDSMASSNNRSHHSLTAFLGNAGGGATAGQDVNRSASQQSSSFGLPRFIVPKVNALKLPIVCLIKSLDDELMREIFIHRYELGQYLIDNLKVSLGLGDEKYFGLKMADSLDEQEDVRRPWLDLNESVYKQISKHGRLLTRAADLSHEPTTSASASVAAAKSVNFYLRIKFYPPNLARVQDQFLKQYLWLQLSRDLRLGKLTSSMNNLTYLMACVLQHELGDFKPELVNERLPTMSILPNQDLIEQQAIDIWQRRLAGAKRHLVMMQFLRASVILETYGFDYYPVRDHQRQRAYLLGFNYAGVKTIRNGRIVNHFRWHNLSKISYERRMIIFHIYPSEHSKRKQILGFKCLSNDECQNLYLRLLEQKYFFTVDLAYFDKSIRHPSHLQDASLAATTLAHPSNQSSGEWTTTTGGDQPSLDAYFGAGEPDEQEEEEEAQPNGESPSSRRRSVPRLRPHLGASRSEEGPPRAARTLEPSDGCSNLGEPAAERRSLSRQLEGATAAFELDPRLEWHHSGGQQPLHWHQSQAGEQQQPPSSCMQASSCRRPLVASPANEASALSVPAELSAGVLPRRLSSIVGRRRLRRADGLVQPA